MFEEINKSALLEPPKIYGRRNGSTIMSARNEVLRVDWDSLGEMTNFEHVPGGPRNWKLLRFTVYISPRQDDCWEEVDNTSYCTNMPAGASKRDLRASLLVLFREFQKAIAENPEESLRGVAQRLSWISDCDYNELIT